MTDRRNFLKTLAAGCAASVAVPSVLQAKGSHNAITATGTDSRLIVPKANGMRITGTYPTTYPTRTGERKSGTRTSST